MYVSKLYVSNSLFTIMIHELYNQKRYASIAIQKVVTKVLLIKSARMDSCENKFIVFFYWVDWVYMKVNRVSIENLTNFLFVYLFIYFFSHCLLYILDR